MSVKYPITVYLVHFFLINNNFFIISLNMSRKKYAIMVPDVLGVRFLILQKKIVF